MAFPDNFKNLEAEMSVIGAILLEPECLSEIGLCSEDFFHPRHRLVYAAALELSCLNEPVDMVAITTRLRRNGDFERAGGSLYLSELAVYVPTSVNVGYYCHLVREAAARRRLAEKGREIARIAEGAESASEALDQAESFILALRNSSGAQSGPELIATILPQTFKRIERTYEARGEITGVQTGFQDLDELTCGLQPSDLIIIAGRPSMGKTSLGLNIAENAASQNRRALVFSLEMSKEQLTNRLIASNAKVDTHRFRNGAFQTTDWEKMTAAAGRIHPMPLLIDDSPSLTVLDIRAASRRILRDGGLELVVVDYLQLMRSVTSYSVREREVAEISRSLKALAKELNVPIVVLAQLNRNLEAGPNPRRPVPSDLRESGSLEQDADLILFPWREAAYCPDCRMHGRDCGKGHFRQAEIIIGKQRNGPVGTVKVAWLPEFCRFESIVN